MGGKKTRREMRGEGYYYPSCLSVRSKSPSALHLTKYVRIPSKAQESAVQAAGEGKSKRDSNGSNRNRTRAHKAAAVALATAASSVLTSHKAIGEKKNKKKKERKHSFFSLAAEFLIHHLLPNSNSSVQHPWMHCKRQARRPWSLWHQEPLLSKSKQ